MRLLLALSVCTLLFCQACSDEGTGTQNAQAAGPDSMPGPLAEGQAPPEYFPTVKMEALEELPEAVPQNLSLRIRKQNGRQAAEVLENGRPLPRRPLPEGLITDLQVLVATLTDDPARHVDSAFLYARVPVSDEVDLLVIEAQGVFYKGSANALIVGQPVHRTSARLVAPLFLAVDYHEGSFSQQNQSWVTQLRSGGTPEFLTGIHIRGIPRGVKLAPKRHVAFAWDQTRFRPIRLTDSAAVAAKYPIE